MEENVRINGLLHCRSEDSILSAHCHQVQGEEFDCADVKNLPQETEAINWSLPQDLLTMPQEHNEQPDSSVELGVVS